MKLLVSIMLLMAVIGFPPFLFADECPEGDCQNGSGKGFTAEGEIHTGSNG